MMRAYEKLFRGSKPIPRQYQLPAYSRDKILLPSLNQHVPRRVDWRKFGLHTDIQIGNTCWASCTHNNLSVFAKIIGKIYEEPIEHLKACDHRCNFWDGKQQTGGQAIFGLQYCMMKGVFSPRKKDIDSFPSFGDKVPLSGYMKLHPTEEYLIRATAQQPVIVNLKVGKDFGKYKGGIFLGERDMSNTTGHCMNCVGYEDDFFILQNSWPDFWGEDGFMRIGRGICDLFQRCYIPYVESHNTRFNLSLIRDRMHFTHTHLGCFCDRDRESVIARKDLYYPEYRRMFNIPVDDKEKKKEDDKEKKKKRMSE